MDANPAGNAYEGRFKTARAWLSAAIAALVQEVPVGAAGHEASVAGDAGMLALICTDVGCALMTGAGVGAADVAGGAAALWLADGAADVGCGLVAVV